jgi:hypothetical protein
MAEFWPVHTREWVDTFRRRGYPGAMPLAAGVEGAIYDLADGTVAKVWAQRRAARQWRTCTGRMPSRSPGR